jgi:UDP-glucose 4-epimerase
MKKILLTGGLGYIGSHICVELINKRYEVIIIDNLSNSSKNSLDGIKKITGYKPKLYISDLRDKLSLLRIFKENKIESVIHLAGFKSVNESIEAPLSYYNNNINGTITLLEVMDQFDCKSIVFSSSATVYASSNEMPISESAPLAASSPYGSSKLVIERMLQDLCSSDDDWRISILRYFNPAGAHKSGLIGEAPNGSPNNLFPYISKVAIGDLEKLKIFGNDYKTQDGTGVRDYIHVVDLAKGHCKALEFMQDNKKIIVVNLGTGNGFSVLEVVKEFEKACNKKIMYEFSERRGGDLDKCYADPSLALKLLNWKAKLSLNAMCRDTWNWEKKK